MDKRQKKSEYYGLFVCLFVFLKFALFLNSHIISYIITIIVIII